MRDFKYITCNPGAILLIDFNLTYWYPCAVAHCRAIFLLETYRGDTLIKVYIAMFFHCVALVLCCIGSCAALDPVLDWMLVVCMGGFVFCSISRPSAILH